MPDSQTKSASGLADILSDLDTDDPLICDVKLCSTDKRPLAGGVHQAILYAQDHGTLRIWLSSISLADR